RRVGPGLRPRTNDLGPRQRVAACRRFLEHHRGAGRRDEERGCVHGFGRRAPAGVGDDQHRRRFEQIEFTSQTETAGGQVEPVAGAPTSTNHATAAGPTSASAGGRSGKRRSFGYAGPFTAVAATTGAYDNASAATTAMAPTIVVWPLVAASTTTPTAAGVA